MDNSKEDRRIKFRGDPTRKTHLEADQRHMKNALYPAFSGKRTKNYGTRKESNALEIEMIFDHAYGFRRASRKSTTFEAQDIMNVASPAPCSVM